MAVTVRFVAMRLSAGIDLAFAPRFHALPARMAGICHDVLHPFCSQTSASIRIAGFTASLSKEWGRKDKSKATLLHSF